MIGMAYEGDVRRVQRALSGAASNAKSRRRQVDSLVGQRGQYWKGKAADAFSGEYREISGDADKLLRCVDRAGDALGRLPSLIARAERERSQKANEG